MYYLDSYSYPNNSIIQISLSVKLKLIFHELVSGYVKYAGNF